MLYLIAGAPRTGKSILSRMLMDKLGVPWLSTDVMRSVIRDVTPEGERAQKFPFTGFTSNDQLSSVELQNMVQWQITEAESLQVAIESFSKHQLGVRDPQILEGVHLLPKHVRAFLDSKDKNDVIRTVFVLSLDKEKQLQSMKSNTSHFDWLSGASENTFDAVAQFVVAYSQWLKQECDKYQLPYVLREGDFEAENAEILEMILK